MKKSISTLCHFFDSKYYPLFIFFSAIISYIFSIEWFGIIIVLGSIYIGFIICENLKFLISPLLMFIFMFSAKSVSSGIFYGTVYKILIVIAALIMLGCIIAHYIIYKEKIDYKSLIKSKLFYGFVILFVSFLLNGLFDFKEYTVGNFTYALVLIVSFAIPLFLFSTSLRFDENLKDDFIFILYLISVLLSFETIYVLLTSGYVDGSIIKESMGYGWGIWNNAGGIMAICLPAHFYLAYSHKYGYVFYITAVLSYVCIALTLSRSSLLVATIISIVCVVIICIKGENKKVNRIMTLCFAIIGVLGIALLWGKISGMLSDYLERGFSDNGRFEMYKHGLNNFKNHPIFGAGFYNSYELEYRFNIFLPYRYHNTIIQMLATCGIFGILAYIYHRYQTVRLALEKKSMYNLFLILCIISLLLTSLLDNHMFNIYPAFFYVIMLLIIEKTPCAK